MSSLTQKPKDLFLLEGISIVSFNKDFTRVALSQKDNKVYIYVIKDFMKPETWKLEDTLESHIQYVSGIDWNAHTNEILTCSYDKTAFVWTFSGKKWIPSNVVATTKLGYLCVISGSTDLRVYVSSCYLPNVDDKYLTNETKPLAKPFGEIYLEFKANCWMNSVTWNKSGKLGFASGQNATIAILNYQEQTFPSNTHNTNRRNFIFGCVLR